MTPVPSRLTMTALSACASQNAVHDGYGHDFATRVPAALTGRGDAGISVTTRGFARAGLLQLDRMTAAILVHLGFDPVVAAAILHLCGQFGLVDMDDLNERNEPQELVSLGDERTTVRMGIGVKTIWKADRRQLLVPRLPDVLLTALVGRDLREIIDLPFDPAADLTARWAENPQQAPFHTLIKVGGALQLRPEELTAMTGEDA